ncbi:MAG TPA: enoyl-ACP reductase [Candidatus Limnocylindrales bacterium]|nr:enoyl-ACP reductase [Candidatus Limnocylindrales bacterium]
MRLKRTASGTDKPTASNQESVATPESGPESQSDAVRSQAAAEVPTVVARPRVGRRLARSVDDCDGNGLLNGKKALVFGVANDHSIAWGIAKALHDQGAKVGFSSMASLIKRRVRPLAASIGSTFVEGCDVRDDDEIRRVFERWHSREGNLDILVHAVAYAEKEDLAGHFADTSRDGFHTAFDISVYSLIAMAREARPYMGPGSSIITLTYYGAEKVVPHYNVMGVAKAALEASTRYLAADLGPNGIRINAISAGPVRTLSAHGIAGFKLMYGAFADVTPLRTHITIEDVAGTAVYLASDLSGKTTGETIYVDGGFNILGLPVAE